MQDVSLFRLFRVFARIGAFTIGGGYAMLPVIESEMTKRGWIKDDELTDIVVLAQSAPGLLAVNVAIFAGYKIRGLKGSIAATIGAVLPSFLIILLVAMAFSNINDNPYVQRIFMGLRPVAVALILAPKFRMLKKGCRTWWQWLIMFASLALIAVFKVSPIWILLAIIVSSFVVISTRKQ